MPNAFAKRSTCSAEPNIASFNFSPALTIFLNFLFNANIPTPNAITPAITTPHGPNKNGSLFANSFIAGANICKPNSTGVIKFATAPIFCAVSFELADSAWPAISAGNAAPPAPLPIALVPDATLATFLSCTICFLACGVVNVGSFIFAASTAFAISLVLDLEGLPSINFLTLPAFSASKNGLFCAAD